MKNKIIALILSAALLLACFTLGVSAAGEKLTSGVFSTSSVQENTEFEMATCSLPDEAKEYINEMFDKFAYDASFYGAYKASLKVDGVDAAFSGDMDVTINIGDYPQTEIFIFAVNEGTGVPTARIDCVRDGSNFTVDGEAFSAVSGDIIVVMTGVTAPIYTIVPAVICACVALIAIITSVLVVKKKSSKETITD